MFETSDELPSSLASKHIVVVDDARSIRSLIIATLADAGFKNLIGFSNGMDALQYLGQFNVDAIVCDWSMPKLTGVELLYSLRQDDQLEALPFLMLTAAESDEQIKQCIEYRVSDYLIKPFNPHLLINKLLRILIRTDFISTEVSHSEITPLYIVTEAKNRGVA